MLKSQWPRLPNTEFSVGWGVRRIIILLIILQCMGIRALPMQGLLISVVVILLLAPRVRIQVRQFFPIFIFSTIFIVLTFHDRIIVNSIIYTSLVLVIAILYNIYIDKNWHIVEYDLLTIGWWLSFHALISYIIYIIFPNAFDRFSFLDTSYRISGFLINSNSTPVRATGVCWEPGLLQYIANISLFLGIKHSWPKWKLVVSFFAVIVTYSTTGIFAIVPTMLFLLLSKHRTLRELFLVAVVFLIIIALSFTIFKQNIANKFGGQNTSGMIRMRDINVGIELIKQRPILGHGQFDQEYLLSQPNIWKLATVPFGKEFIDISGEFGGGFTNGFLGFFVSYGLIMGTFAYWLLFHNSLIQGGFKERLTFFSISIITFIGEPITNTAWFLMLAISGLYSSRKIKILW